MCEFYDICPSKSGWCMGKTTIEKRCADFIFTAYKHLKVKYDTLIWMHTGHIIHDNDLTQEIQVDMYGLSWVKNRQKFVKFRAKSQKSTYFSINFWKKVYKNKKVLKIFVVFSLFGSKMAIFCQKLPIFTKML